MLTGQLGVVHGTGFWPRAIEVVQTFAEPKFARWNHVVVADSETHCVGAEPGGARRRPITTFTDIAWSRFPLTMHQRALIAKWADDHVNVAYGYFDVFAVGVAITLKRATPEWLANELSNGHSYQCAAFADAAYRAAGVHLFDDNRPTSAVYPASIASRFDPSWLPRKPGTLKGWS